VVPTETNWLEALKQPLDPTELVPKIEVFGGTEFEVCRGDKDARGVVKEHGKLNANVSRCGQISIFGSFMILSAEEVWRANRFL
jgi:hypothetical protein